MSRRDAPLLLADPLVVDRSSDVRLEHLSHLLSEEICPG
jgi:hypothetical protein